jgi:hypothetical protein
VTPLTTTATMTGAVTLPWRLAVAATRATLAVGTLAAPDGPIRRPGGYADLLLEVIGEHGYLARLMELVRDDGGPMRLAATLTELVAPDRPLGRLLARDGVLDGLLAEDGPLVRLLSDDGALERLLAEDGALDRLVRDGGVLERLLAPGGAVDRLTEPGGLIETVLAQDGFVDKLIADGGTLDQLVSLGDTLQHIRPQLDAIAVLIPELSEAADGLNRAVGPLSDLVGRLPGGRRRTPALT